MVEKSLIEKWKGRKQDIKDLEQIIIPISEIERDLKELFNEIKKLKHIPNVKVCPACQDYSYIRSKIFGEE
jgi:hypothetical protein